MPTIKLVEFTEQRGGIIDFLDALRQEVEHLPIRAALLDFRPDDGDPRSTRWMAADEVVFGKLVLRLALTAMQEILEPRTMIFNGFVLAGGDLADPEHLALIAEAREKWRAQLTDEAYAYQQVVERDMDEKLATVPDAETPVVKHVTVDIPTALPKAPKILS